MLVYSSHKCNKKALSFDSANLGPKPNTIDYGNKTLSGKFIVRYKKNMGVGQDLLGVSMRSGEN